MNMIISLFVLWLIWNLYFIEDVLCMLWNFEIILFIILRYFVFVVVEWIGDIILKLLKSEIGLLKECVILCVYLSFFEIIGWLLSWCFVYFFFMWYFLIFFICFFVVFFFIVRILLFGNCIICLFFFINLIGFRLGKVLSNVVLGISKGR